MGGFTPAFHLRPTVQTLTRHGHPSYYGKRGVFFVASLCRKSPDTEKSLVGESHRSQFAVILPLVSEIPVFIRVSCDRK